MASNPTARIIRRRARARARAEHHRDGDGKVDEERGRDALECARAEERPEVARPVVLGVAREKGRRPQQRLGRFERLEVGFRRIAAAAVDLRVDDSFHRAL
eukprot:3000119-Rhodomonas_salina.2